MRRLIVIITVILGLYSVPSKATHIMGGEITWRCSGTQYIFTLKIYRDCNGATISTAGQVIDVWYNPILSSIPTTLVAQNDISPQCFDPLLSATCADGNGSNPIPGLVEEYIFESAPITLSGTPPAATGWVFTWDLCCRNSAIDNFYDSSGSPMTGGNGGHTLRSVMYPYTTPGNPTPNNTNPCYDNSPEFAERPATVLCTGFPFTYNHNAQDAEQDSLVYAWDQPLDEIGTFGSYPPPPLVAAPGYAFNNPFPGPAQNPNNVPATLDAQTGEISLTNYTAGTFVSVIRVDAYKCGQLVASIFRDVQVVYLANCNVNTPPDPSLSGGSFQLSGGNVYSDTVYAGDFVQFNLQASDFEFNDLAGTVAQNITLEASGGQFGDQFTNVNLGCLQPPCATLNPAPPLTVAFGVGTTFQWQTDCAHLSYSAGCNATSNTYVFLLKAKDDFCPAPATLFSTFAITVLPGTAEKVSFNCIDASTTGQYVLTWAAPQDTGFDFINYQVFQSSNPNGPFSPIDSVLDWNVTTFTHIGAPSPSYYYIAAKAGCGYLSASSDTLRPIVLSVAPNASGGVANLSWTPHITPLPATSGTHWKIFREYPTGTWTLLDSTTALSYSDTIDVCDAFINYRIEIYDSLGNCSSISNVAGAQLGDINAPTLVPVDSASVDIDNNFATVSYPMSINGDFEAYIIYLYDAISGAWVSVDTVFDINQVQYININSNAASGPETYGIAVLDSCGNRSPISAEHTTIHLQIDLDVCTQEVTLDWTDYFGFPVDSYAVYTGVDGAPPTLFDTYGNNVFTAVQSGLTTFSTYCYFIEAVGPNGQTARSNQVCVFANLPELPDYQYIRYVTVDGPSNSVELSAFVDDQADIDYYRIDRSNAPNGNYNQVGIAPVPPGTNVVYSDGTALFNTRPYWYKIVAVDSCGQDVFISDSSNTIFLRATAQGGLSNKLEWNAYAYWLGNVDAYNVYRSIDFGAPQWLETISGTSTEYVDDLSQTYTGLEGNGNFCYVVEAVEGTGNPYGFAELSKSNLACVEQTPRLFVPNAFTPNGDFINDFFKPTTLFMDQLPYEMFVFDRWGQQLFYTTNSIDGWDGMFKGQPAVQDNYMYLIRYTDLEGQIIEERGNFQLIR